MKNHFEIKEIKETFPATIRRSGTSLSINIPSNVVKKMLLTQGTNAEITITTTGMTGEAIKIFPTLLQRLQQKIPEFKKYDTGDLANYFLLAGLTKMLGQDKVWPLLDKLEEKAETPEIKQQQKRIREMFNTIKENKEKFYETIKTKFEETFQEGER